MGLAVLFQLLECKFGKKLKVTVDSPVESTRVSIRHETAVRKQCSKLKLVSGCLLECSAPAGHLIFDSLVLELLLHERDSEWSIRMSKPDPGSSAGRNKERGRSFGLIVRRKAKAKIELCVARQIFGFQSIKD